MRRNDRAFEVLRRWAWIALILLALGIVGCLRKPKGMTPIPAQALGRSAERASAQEALWERRLGDGVKDPSGRTSRDPLLASGAEEELWVIARRPANPLNAAPEASPGMGALLALPQGLEPRERVPVPLHRTDVQASVLGPVATVEVTQEFENRSPVKIEAEYVFPLPENAAINEFLMDIGPRRIRGIIRERTEAEALYQQARTQGHVASLLIQERPNVFVQRVANLEPDRRIEVKIRYFHTLRYDDGWYEWVFPMTIGPRYHPVVSRSGIGAGHDGTSDQSTDVHYRQRPEAGGQAISLRAKVNAGVPILEFGCRSHRVSTTSTSPEGLEVTLAEPASAGNRDFILRWRVAGEQASGRLLVHRHGFRGGYFSLSLYPPMEVTRLERQPVEFVFVLDGSGSMSGRPIRQAKAAIAQALRRLRPGDSFQLINFSLSAETLGPAPLEVTPENIRRAEACLARLEGEGGTEMIEGIKAALDFPHDASRFRVVCFLTDGFIGNEAEILRATAERIGASRIFSFGVGEAPNRFLLDGLARLGRGAVAYLSWQEDAGSVMEGFFQRVARAALTEIEVDWNGLEPREVYPVRIPDLLVGRTVTLSGKWDGIVPERIRLRGRSGGRTISFEVPVYEAAPELSGALPVVWARRKITHLSDQALLEPHLDWAEPMRRTALEGGVLSEFTAFVAVDGMRQTSGGDPIRVPVPLALPEGVDAAKTLGEIKP